MGSRSGALVDEHEMIFKKNPRRVVRPAGESCVGAGGFGCRHGRGWVTASAWAVVGFQWRWERLGHPLAGGSSRALLVPQRVAASCLAISRTDYTKSVIDLRPADFAGEGGSLGDRSKSVPGLNTELVRPSACPSVCRGAGCQVEEPAAWPAVPRCSPRRWLVSLLAGGGGGGHR